MKYEKDLLAAEIGRARITLQVRLKVHEELQQLADSAEREMIRAEIRLADLSKVAEDGAS